MIFDADGGGGGTVTSDDSATDKLCRSSGSAAEEGPHVRQQAAIRQSERSPAL